MTLLTPLKPFSEIFIDVDDTLIQTTLTMDQFSNHVNYGVSARDGRWGDNIDEVMSNYDNVLVVEPYPLSSDLINTLQVMKVYINIFSSAPDIGFGRKNRENAVNKVCDLPITFFNNDDDKHLKLKQLTHENSLTIDDKPHILVGLQGQTILMNPDINPGGMSISELIGYIL